MHTSTILSSQGNLTVTIPEVETVKAQRVVALSEPQNQALEWITNGGTLTDAAQYAGVSRQTLYRWISDDPDFRAVYDHWRSHMLDITDGHLVGMGELAVSTLMEAMRNRRDVRAAQFVLKQISALRGRK